jgi:geranylgeranyl reductase
MDALIDSLYSKADQASFFPRSELDEAALGKAGNLASGSARLATPASSFQPRIPSASLRAPPAAPAPGAGADLPQVNVFGSMSDMRKRFESLKTRATASDGTQRKLRVAVVGGGPSGSCAAEIFAEEPNIETYLFERKMDNCKPCGGAIPFCMVSEFDLPENIIDRKVTKMTMVSPTNKEIDIGSTLKPNEYIGMTRREVLDGYLRDRAISKGVKAYNALVMSIDMPKAENSPYTLNYNLYAEEGCKNKTGVGVKKTLEVDLIIGADGANSRVAKEIDAGDFEYAIAFQERIKISDEQMKRYEDMAEMYVGDDVSPDFYGWVFPKYDHVGVGTGTVKDKTAIKKYQDATRARAASKIEGGKIIRVEAHPIPEHYRPKRVVGRVALVGDAAGYVTKCSGEGIYFAAKSGRMAAQAIVGLMKDGTRLPTEEEIKKTYIADYDKAYGPTYTVLDILQKVFYSSNAGRESFVDMCASEYVQKVTFDSYLYKKVQGTNPIEDLKLGIETVGSLLRNYAVTPPDGPLASARK